MRSRRPSATAPMRLVGPPQLDQSLFSSGFVMTAANPSGRFGCRLNMRAPRALVLEFSEPVDPIRTEIRVLTQEGAPVGSERHPPICRVQIPARPGVQRLPT